MPLTRIDLPKGKPAEYRAELRQIVYETMDWTHPNRRGYY